jgi:hypothetical protein
MSLATRHRRLAGLFVLALAAPTWSQTVHVVAGDGSGDFLQLKDAVSAAADGDVILVRPHTERYEATVINGKSLTIVGEGATRPAVEDVRVTNLAQAEVVTLRTLDLEGRVEELFGLFSDHEPGLTLEGNQGVVWLEDLRLQGGDGMPKYGGYEHGRPGLYAEGSTPVVAVDCQVSGGRGFYSVGGTSYPGGAGAELTHCDVAFHGCEASGGGGGNGVAWIPAAGGAGIDGNGSVVFASGSSATGGDTGQAFVVPTEDPNTSGLVVSNGSLVEHLATSFVAGEGDGPSGTPIDADGSSSVADLDDVHRALKLLATIREDEQSNAITSGQPGDVVLLRVAFAPDWTLMPGLKGVQHLGGPTFDFVAGVVGPIGSFSVRFRGPVLPVGVDAVTGYVQPIVAPQEGGLRLVAPSAIVFLNASIPGP